MPTTYEPIATANGTGSSTSIIFSSIPSTYTDLRIIVNATAVSGSISPAIRFNSSAGTAYNEIVLWSDGTSTGSYRLASRGLISAGATQVGVSTTNPGVSIIDVFSYAASERKVVLVSGTVDNNGSGASERILGKWMDTSAITTVDIRSQGVAFSTSTVVTLYGIKAA